MSLKPFPVPLAETMRSERAVDEHRNLYCRHYDECLNHSVRERWESFTCSQCPLKHAAATGPDATDFARQRRGNTGTV